MSQKTARVLALTTSCKSPKPTNCQPYSQSYLSDSSKSSQSR